MCLKENVATNLIFVGGTYYSQDFNLVYKIQMLCGKVINCFGSHIPVEEDILDLIFITWHTWFLEVSCIS